MDQVFDARQQNIWLLSTFLMPQLNVAEGLLQMANESVDRASSGSQECSTSCSQPSTSHANASTSSESALKKSHLWDKTLAEEASIQWHRQCGEREPPVKR